LKEGACPQCGGRLADPSELTAPAREKLRGGRAVSSERHLACPRCAAAMVEVEMRGLRLDRCPACESVWLDEDEQLPGRLGSADLTLFALSLPERALRSLLGSAGGAVHEATQVLVPLSIRRTRFFRSAVEKGLRFLVEDVGGVEGRFAKDAAQLDVARAAVGNFLDTAGLVALHASPIWVLAIVSDLSHGSRTYLQRLGDELVRQGVLPEGTAVDGVEALLGRLENVSGKLAESIDQPPLSVARLRESVQAIRRELGRSEDPEQRFPKEEIERTWSAMTELAEREGRPLFEVSSAITVVSRGLERIGRTVGASLSVGADLAYEGIFKHYLDTIGEMHREGYYASIARRAGPYLEAVRHQLSTSKESFTERLFSGRLFSYLRARWKARRAAKKPPADGRAQ